MKSFLTIILFSVIFSQDCTDGRYIEELFNVNIQYDVEFGENTNQNFIDSDYTQTLFMDIYEPEGDEFSERPLIIFMFGGAFISGTKRSDDIVDLCLNYASRGYVAAAIDYRLTTNLVLDPSEEKAYEAVIKAIQDLRAAIRYFRMDDEIYDNFRIDSNRIYAGGVSAGAIASLNSAYLNTQEEALSLITADQLEELGGLEGNSGTPGYSSEVHGIVNLCGAIGNYNWIIQPDVPIVSMHGDEDSTVPYSDNAVTLFGLDVQVYGSYIIHQTMLELDNYSALHTYEGQDHVPFTNNMNFESEFSSEFLYEIVCSNSNLIVGDINQDDTINVLDVIILVNFILGTEVPDEVESFVSDINGDQIINVLDAIMLVNLILET